MKIKKILIAAQILLGIGITYRSFTPHIAQARDYSIPLLAKLSASRVVRIYGAGAPGSGVIVRMPNNDGTGSKTVLFTAYHVVSSLGESEIIEIELPDGRFIEVPASSSTKVGDYDLAVINFPDTDNSILPLATDVGNSNNIGLGDQIVIAGFPLTSESNISKRVRIKPGVIQTFSSTNKTENYVGYDAKTVPGMSGGGVFSMDGKLLLIHLKGEKDLWDKDILVNGRPLKSGTNYGIPALLALKEVQRQTLEGFKGTSDLEEFKKGLYLIGTQKKQEALKVFINLSKKHPDSLLAEWNAACMKLELSPPLGITKQSILAEEFVQKNKINPFYWIPFASDDIIWKAEDRLTLLEYDPIYNMARKPGKRDLVFLNRGSYVRLNFERTKCERIAGLKTYTNNNGEKITYWWSIPN